MKKDLQFIHNDPYFLDCFWYVIVPGVILKIKELTSDAKILLCYFNNRHLNDPKTGLKSFSFEELSEEFSLTEKQIKKAINLLISQKFIKAVFDGISKKLIIDVLPNEEYFIKKYGNKK